MESSGCSTSIMKLREIFARNMERIRQNKGISQEKLALKAGLDRTYIGRIENKDVNPSLDTVEKVAEVLEVPPIALLEE